MAALDVKARLPRRFHLARRHRRPTKVRHQRLGVTGAVSICGAARRQPKVRRQRRQKFRCIRRPSSLPRRQQRPPKVRRHRPPKTLLRQWRSRRACGRAVGVAALQAQRPSDRQPRWPI